jgi:energy-coupling factor transport system ATP-binding protein
LAIAGALAMRPRYLIMDEPTSMIDARGRDEVARVIDDARSGERGVVLVTHDVAEALRADRVVVLESGRVAFEGGVAELLRRSADFATWGLEVPALARLAVSLERRGLGVRSGAATIDEIVGTLCP